MSVTTQKFKLSKELRHLELGKTLVKKALFFEAFDHFKSSIQLKYDCGIDILIYLYKQNNSPPLELQLLIAKVYLELNLANEALDVFEDILEQKIDHEPTYDTLAKLITKKQLTSKIRLCFERAISNNILYPCIINILPKLYLEDKSYEKAIQLYHQLIKATPNEFSYYKILSELYFRKRDYESASDILSQLIERAPYKSEELIQPIEKIVKKIPRHTQIRQLYANILFRSFKPAEGCEQIETLIRYHPSQKQTAITILLNQNEAFPNHPEILYLLADLMISKELYTDSLTHIQALISTSPMHSDKALSLMQKIIQVYPKHCLALEIIGNIYMQQENIIQALHYYEQCIDNYDNCSDISFQSTISTIQEDTNSPSQNKAKLLMAKILSKSGKETEALELIGELNQTDVSVDATLLKVHILTQDKQTMEALNILKQLEEKHPFQWSIHQMSIKVFEQHLQQTKKTMEAITPVDDPLEYSSLLMTKSHWEKAIQILQNQDQIKTNSDNIQLMIARCFFEQSRYDLALQIYHRQTKETTNKNLMKSLLYLSGLCQLLQSNEEDALQSFESVSTYDQNYLNTQQLIDTLRKKKFLNHNGLVIIGSLSHDMPHYVIRKNHFGPQKKKSHQFEVIGFSQSYNDEGCKQCLKQQYKAAKESFELAIQMDLSFHIPYINLSMVYLMNNDVKMAIETIQKAETITQNCPYTVFIRGLCEIKRNDQESAIRHIQNAIKIYGKESVFHLTMGDLFYQKFQLELAKSYWKKANEAMDIAHIEQSRYRINHFDKITIEYWSTPELLFLK